jgi:putative component of membrane protein insertase Oxa1/YidC/SpoIIIJ protein YidD
MADLEGDRVYRTTVLTDLKPVGCRFYFWCCQYEAIAEIAPQTFATADAARAAMIATAKVDPSAQGFHNLVPGVDAISYRTKFFGPDGARDWACAFVKGKVMVVVRTQRSDTSFNAREIVQAIAAKF